MKFRELYYYEIFFQVVSYLTGPFEVICMNSPLGIHQYVDTYGKMMDDVLATFGPKPIALRKETEAHKEEVISINIFLP